MIFLTNHLSVNNCRQIPKSSQEFLKLLYRNPKHFLKKNKDCSNYSHICLFQLIKSESFLDF